MTILTPPDRWKPVEVDGWTRCAYGRRVMFHSNGGTLKTTLASCHRQFSLTGDIASRMLIEVYGNEEFLFDEVISDNAFDRSIDLTHVIDSQSTKIEVHFIPATFGTVRIDRDICTMGPSKTILVNQSKSEHLLHRYSFG